MIVLPKWAQICHKKLWLLSTSASEPGLGGMIAFRSATYRSSLCATSVQQSTYVVWNPFESGLHIHSLCLGFSPQKTFSECPSGDLSCVFCDSCANKCRNHRNFLHTQTLRRQKRFKIFGKTTPSHSLLSEISKDSFTPKSCWGLSCLTCSKSFCCSSASCKEDQLMVTTAVFRNCKGRSQSSAVLVFTYSALPVRQGGWRRYGNMDAEMGILIWGTESHKGCDGAACIRLSASLSPEEMFSPLF